VAIPRQSHGRYPATTWAGSLGLLALALLSIPLAAPGPEFIPGAGADAPRWVLGAFGEGFGLGGAAYQVLLIAAFLAYLGLLAGAAGLRARRVWGAIAALVALFALAGPLLSLDVFSYITYARLGAEHGLNPYESTPADLPADPAASRVDDWRFSVSVYGPGFTLASYPLGLVGVSAALWSLKALTALAVLALAWLTARIAAARGVNPAGAAAFVALNPLVLVHVVGGAHNDALMMLLVMAGVCAVLAGRAGAGGASLVAGAAVKFSGTFAAPFAFVGSARRMRLLAGAAAAAVMIGAATLAAFGSEAAEAFGLAGGNQSLTSYWSVPSTVARITGIDVDPIRFAFLAGYAALAVWLLAWTARGGDWVRAAGWAAFGLLVATAWLVPWYVIWVLPLAAVARDRALWGAALALTAFQLSNAVPG
jgi:Glycosyltransferase family 87